MGCPAVCAPTGQLVTRSVSRPPISTRGRILLATLARKIWRREAEAGSGLTRGPMSTRPASRGMPGSRLASSAISPPIE